MGVLEAQHLTSHTALVADGILALTKTHGLQQLEDSDPPVDEVNHPGDFVDGSARGTRSISNFGSTSVGSYRPGHLAAAANGSH